MSTITHVGANHAAPAARRFASALLELEDHRLQPKRYEVKSIPVLMATFVHLWQARILGTAKDRSWTAALHLCENHDVVR